MKFRFIDLVIGLLGIGSFIAGGIKEKKDHDDIVRETTKEVLKELENKGTL